MDRIQQAYADEEEAEEEEQRVSEEKKEEGQRRKRAPEEEETQQPEQQQPQRRRRAHALPDAGALLDGSPRATRRHHRNAAAIGGVAPRPTALPLPPLPQQEQQHQLGPPLHDGNFPFLVYVPVPTRVPLADALAALAAAAAPSVPGLQTLVGPTASSSVAAAPAAAPAAADAPPPAAVSPPDVPLHISLTRAGTVRLRQAAPLVAALGRHLAKKEAAAALRQPSSLGRARAFLNDDRTRTFLVLTALDPLDPQTASRPTSREANGTTTTTTNNNNNSAARSAPPPTPPPPRCSPALLRAIAACDGALRELGLPPYYRDGQPHVSLASAPAESHAAMEAAAEGPVAEAVARMMGATGAATGAGGGGGGNGGRRAVTAAAVHPSSLALPAPRCVVCQIGKRRHIVWGSADD